MSDGLDITALRPLNMYGYSKQLFDLHASTRGYLDRIVGLKYFNVFGPNEDHKGDMRSVVNKAFRQILETGRVRLFKSYRPEFADGEQRRDFLYVKDAVDMTLHLVDEPGAHGLFNIGSGESHTWRELVGAVFSALGRPAEIEFIDMPAELRGKYQYSTEAAIDRLARQDTAGRSPRSPTPSATTSPGTSCPIGTSATSGRLTGFAAVGGDGGHGFDTKQPEAARTTHEGRHAVSTSRPGHAASARDRASRRLRRALRAFVSNSVPPLLLAQNDQPIVADTPKSLDF